MSVYKEIYSRLRREKQIIGFAGKKRSGKDTAAKAIEDLGYRPVAFADPIKETCQNVFHFTEDQIDGSKKGEIDGFWEFSPRWAMQQIGTELFRDGIDKEVWAKSLLSRIDNSDHEKWAVTDVRFPNEVRHLQKAGAEVVYIKRPECHPSLNPMKKWFAKQDGIFKKAASFFVDFGPEYHASEISLDDHPVTNEPDIVNDGTIGQFRAAVRKHVKDVESGKNGRGESGKIFAKTM